MSEFIQISGSFSPAGYLQQDTCTDNCKGKDSITVVTSKGQDSITVITVNCGENKIVYEKIGFNFTQSSYSE